MSQGDIAAYVIGPIAVLVGIGMVLGRAALSDASSALQRKALAAIGRRAARYMRLWIWGAVGSAMVAGGIFIVVAAATGLVSN